MWLFVADVHTGEWSELTEGDRRTVRVVAADLQQDGPARASARMPPMSR